jgi:dienelactone hydrolase
MGNVPRARLFWCDDQLFPRLSRDPAEREQRFLREARALAKSLPLRRVTTQIEFRSHDDHSMFGKLVLPAPGPPKAIVICVQSAEGATVDMKRPLSRTESFNYYDFCRDRLTGGLGFFSYEDRGIRMGDRLPRIETIDTEVFNTGTLDNKVRDILSAISAVRGQPGLEEVPVFLMGASEGTLLAAAAASREPDQVQALILYGVLASSMRENFRYIMSDGAFPVDRQQFDTGWEWADHAG